MTHQARHQSNNIGFIRLALAILVILGHSAELLDGDRHRDLMVRVFGLLSLGEVAVDGFFLLSGYLITHSFLRDPRMIPYLSRRIRRILPGYLAAYLISLFGLGALAGGNLQTLWGIDGIKSIIRPILLLEPAS